LDRARGGVRLLQPYQAREGNMWYGGTADAVFRNLDYIRTQHADQVIVLSGDHIYKMDYRPMLRFHQEMNADLTVGVMHVPLAETDRFGIMQVNDEQRITAFFEKPKARDKGTLASMGIYIFDTMVLAERLELGNRDHPDLDFGKHVIPELIAEDYRVFAYAFDGYWVDVGTIQSYWETNLALLAPNPPLDLYDTRWVIHTQSQERPPVKVGVQGQIVRSLVANGCTVSGRVEHSILSSGVNVSPDAIVRDSIVMNDAWIGAGAVLDRVIVDKDVVIGANTRLGDGDDHTPNHDEPDKLFTGISVVGKGAQIPENFRVGRNVVIHPGAREENFIHCHGDIHSGETV
ncbi:MAG: glucose-1-phosphate adenylyltransferase, partial [Chloroflexi bacterium]|nr:glucose-1-phosphate adenylyltransferase [Chloroflexota bacterium]